MKSDLITLSNIVSNVAVALICTYNILSLLTILCSVIPVKWSQYHFILGIYSANDSYTMGSTSISSVTDDTGLDDTDGEYLLSKSFFLFLYTVLLSNP